MVAPAEGRALEQYGIHHTRGFAQVRALSCPCLCFSTCKIVAHQAVGRFSRPPVEEDVEGKRVCLSERTPSEVSGIRSPKGNGESSGWVGRPHSMVALPAHPRGPSSGAVRPGRRARPNLRSFFCFSASAIVGMGTGRPCEIERMSGSGEWSAQPHPN